MNAKQRRVNALKDQKDMLRNQVWAVCCGACGEAIETGDHYLMPTDLSRAIPALKEMFQGEPETEDGGGASRPKAFLFAPGNLAHYETVDTITDFFFEYGVRA